MSNLSSGVHPVLLVVLDGWGYSENTAYNAIHSADTPCWDSMLEQCPNLLLSASGDDVGLPTSQMGNSEVGHMHIGAGRVIPQDLTRIMDAIEDGSFHENETMRRNFTDAAGAGKAVHLAGILSPGGVHGHEDLMVTAMQVAVDCGVKKLFLHLFLDGRDTLPKSASESIHRIQREIASLGVGKIASMIGRYYAMDRNKHWNRTAAAWSLLTHGKDCHKCADPLLALEQAYADGKSDEFIEPVSIDPEARVRGGDLLLFLNFRADRIRQLAAACAVPDFSCFDRGSDFELPKCMSMTRYEKDMPLEVVFPPSIPENVLGEVLADKGLRQFRIAETEKYAHVTYFLNGGRGEAFLRREACSGAVAPTLPLMISSRK